MNIEVVDNADLAALKAASIIAEESRKAVALRGKFIFAVSGGKTPWKMLRALSEEDVPWAKIHLFQVDERLAPAGHPDRNLTHLLESLQGATIPPDQIYAMHVEDTEPESAAAEYSTSIRNTTGSDSIIDLIHLGLGSDGHTASLIPGERVLDITDQDVALTGIYQGRRRMTLTYPLINRARKILWLVTGAEKNEMLKRLIEKDTSIPAGRISQEQAVVLADREAAVNLR